MDNLDPQEIRLGYHNRVRGEVLQLVPSGLHKVLDIGGGIGTSSAYLKSIGKCSRAIVVDLVADSCLSEIDVSYSGDLDDPTFLETVAKEQGGMDVILCLDVLEHIKDPWSVIERCNDILNPGGVIVASIPNARNYRLVIPLVFFGKFELKDGGILDRTHLRWFVRDTAIDLMTHSGLELELVRGHIYGWKKRAFNIVTFGLFRNFLYLQYFIRVRRPGHPQ
jgi:2-polyprenyl-3-methyl-5-hydroxy-6-metoxy-1,4-benzoquinol methylase